MVEFKRDIFEFITIKNSVLILIWTAFGSGLNLFNQNSTLYLIQNTSTIIYSQWGMQKKIEKKIFV